MSEEEEEEKRKIMVHKANLEIEKMQNYLARENIYITESEIVLAAIRIATRWGGNWAFVCELQKPRGRRSW
jgi:hypothetical protein